MHCHANGVIHHDLKLENILINTNQNGVINRVKIADFGLSRQINNKLTAGPDTRGTVEYVAPEMIVQGTCFDERIDLWAIGIILHKLLLGEFPFDSNDDHQTIR